MTANIILFIFLAIVAVGTALGMLFSRNAIYAALFLILNFGTVAIFYLMLNAPFISISQVTVYAGAIMVLFLFVIMLLGAEQTGRTPTRWWLQPWVMVFGALLLVEVFIAAYLLHGTVAPPRSIVGTFGEPQAIGETLFSSYLLPFEATSILLLVAMIGAIVLTRGEKN